jgi:3-oxoacyl-[acyl-carrier-protein] synthase III
VRRCRIESLGASLPQRKRLFRWGSTRHAVHAGRAVLNASRHRPADVELLFNAGVHRDGPVCEPAIASYIQHALDINIEFQGRRTLSFDLINGGCGMLNAVHVASALMESGEIRVGMVVSSEANSDRRPDPEYTYAASGAALMLDISPVPGVGFGHFVFKTREEHAGLYTSVVSLAVKKGRLILRRRVEELEEAWLSCAREVVDELLDSEGIRREEISLVVPAQISPRFLGRLGEAIGFPREKVADLSSRLPDTLSTSTFLALHDVVSRRCLASGGKALLLAFGSGITVGAATCDF